MIPSITSDQFKVPATKNSPINNVSIQSQVLQNVPITPMNTQTSLIKINTPQIQSLTTSSKTALPVTSQMSRTDKIMSSASIISSTIVNPPMDMSKITDLFKNKPSVSVIKTKCNNDEVKDPPPKVQFPKEGLEKKNPVNYNARITKRRQTICAQKFYEQQKKAESQTGRKSDNFQPVILAIPKKIVKTEVDKKVGIKQGKVTQKRQAEEVTQNKSGKSQKIDDSSPNEGKGKNQPQIKRGTRSRPVKSSEPEYQYWIKTKADGYYIETFTNLETATSYLEKLPPDATYGPLSND